MTDRINDAMLRAEGGASRRTIAMRELPRDLVTILRTEAKNQRTPPIDYVIADDCGRMVHQPEPDIAMAELLEEAATALAAKDAELAAMRIERDESRRRRDEWRKKAEGYDEVRRALREKIGATWPPNMSRALWAGIAADEKKRADDAEAQLAEARKALDGVLEALDGEPEYHGHGMGCGLEDRNITDRYEAMEYGWECAMERVYGEHINPAIEISRRVLEGGNDD